MTSCNKAILEKVNNKTLKAIPYLMYSKSAKSSSSGVPWSSKMTASYDLHHADQMTITD